MAGVEVDSLETVSSGIGADGSHESQAFSDALDNALVLGFDIFVTHMAQAPIQWGV